MARPKCKFERWMPRAGSVPDGTRSRSEVVSDPDPYEAILINDAVLYDDLGNGNLHKHSHGVSDDWGG